MTSVPQRVVPYAALLAAVVFFSVSPDLAHAAGIDRVNTVMEKVVTILKNIAIPTVTIAIMWAGYKYLFRNADILDCAKIVGGGLLIGGAAELASFLLV